MKMKQMKKVSSALVIAGSVALAGCNGGTASTGGQNLTGAPISATAVKSLFATSSCLTGKINFSGSSPWYLGGSIDIINSCDSELDLKDSTISLTSQDSKAGKVNVGTLNNWWINGSAYKLVFTSGNGNQQIGTISADNGNAIIKAKQTISFSGGLNLNGSSFNADLAQSSFTINGTTPVPTPTPTPTPVPTPTPTPTPVPTPTPTPTPSGDYPVYPSQRGTYTGGTLVYGSDGKLYECLSTTVAPWCNSKDGAWAYAPGSGSYWSQAWKLASSPTPTPTPTPTQAGSMNITVDTSEAGCNGAACGNVTVSILNSNGTAVSSFNIPSSALGGTYSQQVNNLVAGSYTVAGSAINSTTVSYKPSATAAVTVGNTSAVTVKYDKIVVPTGKATISLGNYVANYTGTLTVEVLDQNNNPVNGGTFTMKQGDSVTTTDLPVSDTNTSYHVKVLTGIADPLQGLYYVESGEPTLTITKDTTKTFNIPMVKSSVSQSDVTLAVTGLEGSDKASVVFSDGAGKYSYANYSNLGNGSVTYKIENNLNLGTTVTASGSNSYAVNPITNTGLVTADKIISAGFQKQVAPVVKKINATYWAMWGSNTSYDVGGTYPSVAVDAPNIDSSYNVIIASFIITDSSGNYILSTYDPGSNNPVKYYTDDQIINFVKQVKAQGRKIIVSLGGEKFHLTMKTDADVATFATQVDKIIDKYGFEGIDLDLEGGATAEDPVLLAKAVMQVVNNYRGKGQDFWLTMAPEWVYVIPYGYGCGQWGSHNYHNTFYAKLVNSLGINNINYIWPQTYNQGPANGICGSSENEVKPGSGMDKFVAALTWAATTESGFAVNTRGMTGDIMPIIPSSKFVIGIPATLGAAGGYMAYVMTPALISSSWQVMKNTYGISAGGFMNWAADWDNTNYTNSTYNFSHTPWETGRAVANTIK